MRLHRYPGLFGDPRSRGLRLAMGVSLAAHLIFVASVSRIQTRPAERTFFAPVHFVDLVEHAPGPIAPPAAPKAQPTTSRTPPETKPAKTPPPAKTATVKPSTPEPKPKIDRQAVERLLSKTKPPPETTAPAETRTEENISERIARMKEKYGSTAPPAETTAPPEDGGRVDDAIASIRQRVATTLSSAKGGETGKVGVRSGASNTLQQVRLRAYYNQLWDHVSAYWTIPPSLQGRNYTVIVSVVLDRQGNLVRSWIEEPSASSAFDESALRALQRAKPLPRLPESIEDPTLEVGFRFHRD